MKVIASTDEYTVYQRRDGRYAVTGADKKPINAEAKVAILLQHELIVAPQPKVEEPAAEPAEEPAEEVAAEDTGAEEAAEETAEEAPAEEETEAAAEEAPAEEEAPADPADAEEDPNKE